MSFSHTTGTPALATLIRPEPSSETLPRETIEAPRSHVVPGMADGGTATWTRAWNRPSLKPIGIMPTLRSNVLGLAVGAPYADSRRAVKRLLSPWMTRRPRTTVRTFGRSTLTETVSGLSSGHPAGSKLNR